MNIFLIYGGKSAEHDVSVVSAYHILQEINYKRYQVLPIFINKEGRWIKGDLISKKEDLPSQEDLQEPKGEDFQFEELKSADLAFPVLHGPNGEDGTIQGLFEMLDVPYVGCGVLASSAGMDKIVSKVLFEEVGIPIVPYEVITEKKWEEEAEKIMETIERKLPYPIYIKPANLGSSVGITEAHTREDLEAGIKLALEYDQRVLVEEGVTAREVEIAVLGNEDVKSSLVGALVKEKHFYDYDSKYLDGEVTLQIPADLKEGLSDQLRDYAVRAFQTLDGSGLARVDFFVREDNSIFINEINTFPGFTPISMYPKLWEATGLSYGDLIEELIQLGLKRYEARKEKDGRARK